MRYFMFFMFLPFLLVNLAHSESVSNFSDIWLWIKEEHPELKASREEVLAAKESVNRSDLHWLPSVYFAGKGFSTNDSAQTFVGNLGQRAVSSADFNPSTLNQPGSHTFAQFGLGANLPIYEGGGASSYSQMQNFASQAKDQQNSAEQIEVYSNAVSVYAGILNADSTLIALEELKTKVNAILNRYSLGSRSNPVGYSGLLGLKSILNRIDASLNQVKLLRITSLVELQQRTKKLDLNWGPKKEKVGTFLISSLPDQSILGDEGSFVTDAAQSNAEIIRAKISLGRSRFLPQLGLFTEGNYQLGSRDSATSYVGGVYIKWSIFNPKDFGIVGELSHLSAAANARMNSERISEKIAHEADIQALKVLEANEKILSDSTDLMSEQVLTAAKLFQSGSINALQMVEVFNRRADLILQFMDLNQQNIQVRGRLAKTSRLKGVSL